ncbi:MAG TPA: hypothetical protein VHG51_11430 [Longimicrobiaceae bacterium]|nr:hypothetical protein [Longimicrobiaceae bacterium]
MSLPGSPRRKPRANVQGGTPPPSPTRLLVLLVVVVGAIWFLLSRLAV